MLQAKEEYKGYKIEVLGGEKKLLLFAVKWDGKKPKTSKGAMEKNVKNKKEAIAEMIKGCKEAIDREEYEYL